MPTAREDFAQAQRAAERAGRDPAELTLAMAGITLLREDRHDEVAARLAAARDAGVQHAVLGLHPANIESTPERIVRFAERYLDEVRAE
jgi:hypothetical protein